jgi:hypothetical protein
MNFDSDKVPKKKRKGLPPSQENHSIYPSDTPSASHKKYRHAAALKRLEPGDDIRHHVGVVRTLQVEDAVLYCRNQDH